MAKLIRNRRVAVDSWRLLKPDAEGKLAVPASGDVIVPLSTWKAEREALAGRKGKTGVGWEGREGPKPTGRALDRLPIVALHFSSFGDGRAFSSARLLRERYGYKGE